LWQYLNFENVPIYLLFIQQTNEKNCCVQYNICKIKSVATRSGHVIRWLTSSRMIAHSNPWLYCALLGY